MFIDMTAMSDVTVLLLTFFMLTSTFVKKEPVQVFTPASVSEIKIPETNILQILVDPHVFGFFAGNFTESGYGIGQVNDFTAGVNGRKHSREYAAFCYYAGDHDAGSVFCEFTYLRDGEGGVDAFCVYRVFFCVGQKLGHHFVEPGVCVYGGVDFVVFFPYAFRVFCGEVLGEDHLRKGAAV